MSSILSPNELTYFYLCIGIILINVHIYILYIYIHNMNLNVYLHINVFIYIYIHFFTCMGNHGASKCMSNVPSAGRNWWLVWASERLLYSAALQNASLGIVFDFTIPIHAL